MVVVAIADRIAELVGTDVPINRVEVTEENIAELREMISPLDQRWELSPGERISYWEGHGGDVILFHNYDRAGVCIGGYTVWGDLNVEDGHGRYILVPEEGDPILLPAPRRWFRTYIGETGE